MKREYSIRDSQFNKFGMKRNWLGNVVYVQLNFTDEDLMNANYDSEVMVTRKVQPMINYLSRDLDWGDYLTMQISNFVDEDETPSLSYGIIFLYTPYRVTMTGLLLSFMGLITAIGAAAIFLLPKCLA